MSREFGERLASLLKEKNLQQQTLAQKAGVTEAAVSHYIKGDRMPRANVLAKIADVLGTTSEYLLNGTANNSEEELNQARRLIARNVKQMSKEEKMKIVEILFEEEQF